MAHEVPTEVKRRKKVLDQALTQAAAGLLHASHVYITSDNVDVARTRLLRLLPQTPTIWSSQNATGRLHDDLLQPDVLVDVIASLRADKFVGAKSTFSAHILGMRACRARQCNAHARP